MTNKYGGYLTNAKKKLALYHEAKFMDNYATFLKCYEKTNMKIELAVKVFCEMCPSVKGPDLDEILEKFKNDMMLEMKYEEKMKEFVAYHQMYLDIEHAKMAEDGNTREARAVIKDWLQSTPGMEEVLRPKREGPLVKINSDNKTTNVLSFNPRLRLSDLPAKWQELAMEMKDKKLLERKTVDIQEFEGDKVE